MNLLWYYIIINPKDFQEVFIKMSKILISTLEIIGTIAFSISGSLLAIECNLDFFGVIVIAIITSVGGGMFRDIILGITPPTIFINPLYVSIAFYAAISILILYRLVENIVNNNKHPIYSNALNLFDALGLAIFTIVGMNTAIDLGHADNIFLCVFVGVLTGVGGGMLRDILVQRVPVILRKQVYAVASLIGGLIYYILRFYVNNELSMPISIITVVIIRVIAMHFKYNLPTKANKKNK